jgi:tetratricopeptide (TPR) repeat protein
VKPRARREPVGREIGLRAACVNRVSNGGNVMAMLRVLGGLCLLIAATAGSGASQVPAAEADAEQAVRAVIQQFIDARATGDLDAALAAWDPAADTSAMRGRLQWVFKTAEQVPVKFAVGRVAIKGDQAEARVDSGWTFIDRRNGSSRDVREQMVFTLVRGPNGWRLSKEANAVSLLADALMDAPDEASRSRRLAEDPSLVGLELVGFLIRHGQQAQKDFPRALTAYTLAEQLARRLDNREALANALQGIGNVHYFAGRYERALEAFERRVPIEEALGEKGELASAVVSVASAKYALGRYLEARDAYERHRTLVERAQRTDQLVAAHLNIANCDLLLGDHEAARDTYTRALELSERAVLKTDLPRVLYGLGRAHAGLGDYRRANEAFTRALMLHEQANDLGGVAATLVSMGQTAFEQGQHGRALEHYARSRGIFEARKDDAGVGQTWVATGLIRAARAEHQEAVRGYEQAIPSFERAKDADGLAQAHLGLGYALTNLNQFDAADAAYEKARKLYEVGNRIGLTRTLLGIGLLRLAQEKAAPAAEMSRKAFEMARAVRHRGLEAHAETLAGRAQLRLGNSRAAEEAFARSIALVDAMAFDADADAGISAEDLDEPYHGLVETFVQRGDVVRALAASERGRVRHLQYVLRNLALAPGMTPEERTRERRLKAEAHISGKQLLHETERPKPDPKRVTALEGRTTAARAALTKFRTALYRDNALVARARGFVTPIDPAAAWQAIPADTVVLVHTVTHSRAYTFALSAPSAPRVCGARDAGPPGTPYVVTEGIGRLGLARLVPLPMRRVQAGEPHTESYLRALGAMFLDPVGCHLERASTVIVVPDGALWQVPYEMMKADDGCDAIEKWSFVYAPSLTFAFTPASGPASLERAGRAQAGVGPRPEIMSGPPNAAMDGRVVISDAAPLYSYVEWAGAEPTRVELQQLVQQQWPSLVTVPRGEIQALATADGDGLTAWIWTLAIAGVRAALVPRWTIDDRALALFSIETGDSPESSALTVREVVMRIRNHAVHGKPSNWATFMLVGAAP